MMLRSMGLELDFGGVGLLRIAPPGHNASLPTVQLQLIDGLWRVTSVSGSSSSADGTLMVLRQAGAASRHPALNAEIFAVEGKGRSGAALKIKGLPAVRAEGMLGQDRDEINHGQIGTMWLRVGGGALPITVLPRHFIAEDGSLEDAVTAAMQRLRGMVEDLWREAAKGVRLHRAAGKEQGGQAVKDGGQEASWWQRLARLEDLLYHQGVIEAWQALLADPVVHLEVHRPVVPIYKAARAELGGSRGPWSLPQGWSPYRPAGNVRDRRVVRTVDTPPNRLAVALAELVCRELDEIERTMKKTASAPALERLCARLRRASEEVLSAPRLSEVRRGVLPTLGSPSLQLNTRCRALLQAWDRIHTDASLEVDLRLEHAMQEPLARAELLYERWCFVRLCHLLREKVGMMGQYAAQGPLLSYAVERGAARVAVVYSADNTLKDEDARLQRFSQDGETRIESFSLVSKPDGLLLIQQAGETAAHVWDAKYRRLKVKRFGSSDLYQAHAFRDALWVDGHKPKWSLVLHPWDGAEGIEVHRYPVSGRKNGAATPSDSSPVIDGGVGIFLASPSGKSPGLSKLLDDLLRSSCPEILLSSHRSSA